MRSIKPGVTEEMWITQAEVAEHVMNSDSQEASDYTAAGLTAIGAMVMWALVNRVIKHGSGPFGGIVDMAMKVFKPDKEEKLERK